MAQQTDTERDEPWTPSTDDATFHHYDDDGVARTRHTDRWQKHGHDRIYPNSADEGYIDLNAGEVVDLKPRHEAGIKEYEFEYDDARDALVLWAVGERKAVRNSLSKKTKKEVARIPCELMGEN